MLKEKGVINSSRWFRYYAIHRGDTTKVKSGTYTLRDDLSPRQVLDRLTKGVRARTVTVTIREGLNMLEVIAEIAQHGVASADEMEEIARDPKFASDYEIPGNNVEGYLFPETYQFRGSHTCS